MLSLDTVVTPVQKSWCKPLVVGDVPSARSGHSATMVQSQLIIFGGWDAPVAYNDVYALDMTLMEFSKLEIKGTPPRPRLALGFC